MKLALFVALATVAAVASYRPSVHSAVYKPGEQYVYHYKGQILSGIPKSSKQFSGLLIDTLVVLQFQQDSKVVMKIENVKLFKINDKIVDQPDEPLSETDLVRLTGEQEQVVVEKLHLPVKFSYDQGEVRELQKEFRDPYWSLNIKKGILSMLQVTLKEKHSSSSESSSYYDPTMSRIKSYGSRSHGSASSQWNISPKTNSVYRVKETDVTGNCETKYTIISDKSRLSSSSSEMFVSAVRNFEDCVTKPFYIEGLFQGVYSSQNEKDLIQPLVHTDYVISGDRSHFLIKEATSHAKYGVYVNGLEGGDLSTFTHQTLKLKQVTPIRTPIHMMTPRIESRGLLMTIPKANLVPQKESSEKMSGQFNSFMQKKRMEQEQWNRGRKSYEEEEEMYEDENSEERQGNVIQIVEQQLEELVQCMAIPSASVQCSEKLIHITKLLKETNKEQLKSLYDRYIKHEPLSPRAESKKREILLDVLPTLRNPEAAKVLLELIREQQITTLRGSVLINAMSLVVKPTPSVIKQTLELFKELPKETTGTTLSGKALLRQSTLLAVGTLTHRLIVVMRSHGKPVPEVISFIDSVSMELKRMLEETQSESEKILVLKSMGNMGASENIMILKNTVEDRRQSTKVRVSAAFGLRRLAKEFRKQVNPILIGVFMDVKEKPEIRQACFIVIMKANPTLTTLQMIAHRLRHEPSSQIRTLVYSNLINLAFYTSHQPEHKTLVKNARLVIKTIQPVHVSLYDSMSVFVNKFSDKYDLGAALELTKIKSKKSGLPEALIANIQGTLFGKHRRIAEIGVEGKSLEVILKKLVGPYGLLQKVLKGKISLEQIFKPLAGTNLGGVEQKIMEIMNKMRMELPVEGETFASWYIHLLGNELQYLILNSHSLQDVTNKLMIYVPELLMKLRSGASIDMLKAGSLHSAVTVSTPLGIPLSLNHTIAALIKAEISAKVENMPTDISSYLEPYRRFTLSQSWNEFRRQPFEIPELKLDVVVKPNIDVTQYVTLGADLRWFVAGVGAEAKLKIARPFRVKAEINKPEHSVSLKYYPTKEDTPCLHAKVQPITFFSHRPLTITKLPSIVQVKEIRSEEIIKSKPFEIKMPNSLNGLEYKIQGVYSLCRLTKCPIMPLFGKQEITISTRPVSDVDFVEMKIKSIGSNFEFEGIPSHIPTDQLYKELDEEYESESVNYRTSRRESVMTSTEFEPITVDQIFQNEVPIKRQLRVIIRPSNKQTPALKSQLTWLMSRNYWVNQFNFQAIRSAHIDTPKWKVVLDNIVNPLAWYPEESYRGNRGEYLAKSVLELNVDGDKKVFKLKVVPGSPFDFSEELKEHTILPVDDLPETKVQKYKYTVEVEFPEVRNYQVMKMLTVVRDTIKYHLYDKLTTVVPHTPVDKKLIISVEVLPWWEKMNVIVKSPREDLYITNVPFYWNPFLPTNQRIKLHNTYSWNHYKPTFEDQPEDLFETLPYHRTPILPNGQCSYSVETGKLITFDNVHLPLQALPLYNQRSCSFVLAQHCSKEGLFSIILKGDNVTPKIKVLLPKYEVEWIIQSSSQVTMLVNGEPKNIYESQAVILKDDYSESSEMFKIEKIGSSLYKLEADELGLAVILNSENKDIKIKLSPASMLQGEICGACGNSDFDARNDLYTRRDFSPEDRDYSEFIKSSLIPSESCSLDTIRPSSEESCKKTTLLTVRRYDNETPMTCTTERKVIQCAKGCRPSQTRSVKTCFRCQSESGQTWARSTYNQPSSVWELEDSNVSCDQFSERLELPTTCVPAY
jgi:hypothetical protein